MRFSPFDKNERRQTSHAQVFVLPVRPGAREDFEIDKSELRIDRVKVSMIVLNEMGWTHMVAV